ncbi:MAG: N-succinylarginine dihydrolase [Sphingomonadaceae bacterium]|nr:N-succinylarginine dihydrolase [Sphingomonadaceae bacterium]
MIVEINFDGLIGPSHNYAALSPGNLASARNSGAVSRPRDAALQGIAKQRAALALGLVQGVLLPHDRPASGWLGQLGYAIDAAIDDPLQLARAMSASPMWTANAATVSPAADTRDGRCHLTVANLMAMPHRSHEAAATLAQLGVAFANAAFAVHDAVPTFGDEGAANHMRLAERHDAPGVEIFVYGVDGGGFPARQGRVASGAVARRHGLDPARTLFVEQATAAIRAGAFHNDVVAVANETVVFAHEFAFADPARFAADLARVAPWAEIITVPDAAVSLADAITSYLFNSQLVTLPDATMTLILPTEAQENSRVAAYLDSLIGGNGPIRAVRFVAVRESMRNGGGPACLRLRVVADPATVDPRFLVDDAKLDRIAGIVAAHWPVEIGPDDLARPGLWAQCRAARGALLDALDLVSLS